MSKILPLNNHNKIITISSIHPSGKNDTNLKMFNVLEIGGGDRQIIGIPRLRPW